MSLGKIQRGRFELAIYILLPIVVFAGIAAVEASYSRRVGKEIISRQALLKLLPELERRTQDVCGRLVPFSAMDDGADGSSELTMRVNKTAQERGMLTKSVKLEKLPLPANNCWSDFKVSLSGEGSAKALVQVLDDAERNGTQPFRVTGIRAVAKALQPETVYDAEVIFMSRIVNNVMAGVATVPVVDAVLDSDRLAKLGRRADVLAAAIEKYRRTQWGPLSLKKMESRAPLVQGPVEVEGGIPFKLTGVIRDGKAPLALTDQGLMAVGDESGGYRILEIRNDAVVVKNRQGVKTVVPLYSAGGGP